jgi:hypothetical protein
LKKEYEGKLQDESQHSGRNLALEENQVKTFYLKKKKIFFGLLDERISTFKRRSREKNDTIF